MSRVIISIGLFICILGMLSCSKLISKQEWSENYALLQGVTSTSPEMIDGNLRTLGQTVFPESARNAYGASPASEVIITLPKKKKIRRIVIHSANLKIFDVFADKGGSAIKSTDWQLVKELKSVDRNPIDLSLPVSFATDKIRLRVLGTSDDAALRRKQRARSGGGRLSGANRRAAGKIFEIELYGYQSPEDIAEREAVEINNSREQELDDLLK